MRETDYMETNIRTSIILLVEDEESLAIGLEYNLQEEGYRVIRAADGVEAVTKFNAQDIDLVILDIMLPHLDGFAVAQRIRERSPWVPILMLTARTSSADRIRGLEIGADDYLDKPFHLKELLLRVRGMLKRKRWYNKSLGAKDLFRFGENEIDFSTLSCTAGRKTVKLTPLEAALLSYLVDRPEQVVSRKELLENVWQTTSGVETRTVDNFMVRLRKYFEPDPAHPIYFRNVRGVGYLFAP